MYWVAIVVELKCVALINGCPQVVIARAGAPLRRGEGWSKILRIGFEKDLKF